MTRILDGPSSQNGAALVGVIFLILVVAILGTFAIRTSSDQQQISLLSLQEAKANAAAFSVLEYTANRLKANGTFVCPATVPLPALPQTNGITVSLQCSAVVTGAVIPGGGSVYLITATARSGVFGNPDYVQRARMRRVSSIGTGSW